METRRRGLRSDQHGDHRPATNATPRGDHHDQRDQLDRRDERDQPDPREARDQLDQLCRRDQLEQHDQRDQLETRRQLDLFDQLDLIDQLEQQSERDPLHRRDQLEQRGQHDLLEARQQRDQLETRRRCDLRQTAVDDDAPTGGDPIIDQRLQQCVEMEEDQQPSASGLAGEQDRRLQEELPAQAAGPVRLEPPPRPLSASSNVTDDRQPDPDAHHQPRTRPTTGDAVLDALAAADRLRCRLVPGQDGRVDVAAARLAAQELLRQLDVGLAASEADGQPASDLNRAACIQLVDSGHPPPSTDHDVRPFGSSDERADTRATPAVQPLPPPRPATAEPSNRTRAGRADAADLSAVPPPPPPRPESVEVISRTPSRRRLNPDAESFTPSPRILRRRPNSPTEHRRPLFAGPPQPSHAERPLHHPHHAPPAQPFIQPGAHPMPMPLGGQEDQLYFHPQTGQLLMPVPFAQQPHPFVMAPPVYPHFGAPTGQAQHGFNFQPPLHLRPDFAGHHGLAGLAPGQPRPTAVSGSNQPRPMSAHPFGWLAAGPVLDDDRPNSAPLQRPGGERPAATTHDGGQARGPAPPPREPHVRPNDPGVAGQTPVQPRRPVQRTPSAASAPASVGELSIAADVQAETRSPLATGSTPTDSACAPAAAACQTGPTTASIEVLALAQMMRCIQPIRPTFAGLTKFTGSDPEKLYNFLVAINSHRKTTAMTEDEAIENLCGALDGDAATWWRTRAAKPTTWAQTEAMLRERFQTRRSDAGWMAKAREVRQRDGELGDTFICRMLDVFRRFAHPPDAHTQLSIIYNGLLDRLQRKIGFNGVKSLSDLEEKVREKEQDWIDRPKSVEAPKKPLPAERPKPLTTGHPATKPADPPGATKAGPAQPTSKPRTKAKQHCDTHGECYHSTAECKGIVTTGSAPNKLPFGQRPAFAPRDLTNVKCHGCGLLGHLHRTCPTQKDATRQATIRVEQVTTTYPVNSTRPEQSDDFDFGEPDTLAVLQAIITPADATLGSTNGRSSTRPAADAGRGTLRVNAVQPQAEPMSPTSIEPTRRTSKRRRRREKARAHLSSGSLLVDNPSKGDDDESTPEITTDITFGSLTQVALVDTGATKTFVTHDVRNHLRQTVKPKRVSIRIRLGDGSYSSASAEIYETECTIRGRTRRAKFFFSLEMAYPTVILGMPVQAAFGMLLDTATGTFTFRDEPATKPDMEQPPAPVTSKVPPRRSGQRLDRAIEAEHIRQFDRIGRSDPLVQHQMRNALISAEEQLSCHRSQSEEQQLSPDLHESAGWLETDDEDEFDGGLIDEMPELVRMIRCAMSRPDATGGEDPSQADHCDLPGSTNGQPSAGLTQLRDDEAASWPAPEKNKLEELLARHHQRFARDGPLTDLAVHHIDTGDARPRFQPPYLMPARWRDEVRTELEAMLAAGVIQPCDGPWAAPLLPRRKSDGGVRLCVDYRRLNAVTKPDQYPMPNMVQLIQMVGRRVFVTLLDLRSGYWQVPVAEADREKTGFICEFGLFQFTSMPFGLRNAPATFQRAMDRLRSQIPNVNLIAYLDDLAVLSADYESHLKDVQTVLEALEKHSIRIRRDKCVFACREFKYLGHLITEHGIRPDAGKIAAIVEMRPPRNLHQLRSFIGMCNWFRRFIPGCSKVAEPITDLLKKDTRWSWGESQEKAFNRLKRALTNDPLLQAWDPTKPTAIVTDASAYAIGAALLQGEEESRLPVEYASRLLNAAERNYSATDREALAVVWAVNRFRCFLEGAPFTVYTDHQALKWLLELRTPTGRLARWALLLQAFDMTIRYKPGKENTLADGLSRPAVGDEEVTATAATTAAAVEIEPDTDNVRKLQRADPELRKIIRAFEKNEPFSKVLSNRGFIVASGLLLHYPPDYTANEEARIVVPEPMQRELLQAFHDGASAGHYGRDRTVARLTERYWWKGLVGSVARYVAKCPVCQKFKQARAQQLATPVPLPRRRFEAISVDLVGPLPLTERGNRWIIVMVDMSTRWTELRAIPSAETVELASAIVEDVCMRFGTPRLMLSDNGSDFTAKLMKAVLDMLGTEQRLTPNYHPQSNLVERRNKDFKERLAMLASNDQRRWDHYIAVVRYAVNTARCVSTGYSPAQLVYGCQPNQPVDPKFALDEVALHPLEDGEEIRRVWEGLLSRILQARDTLNAAQEYARRDETADFAPLAIGTRVLCRRRDRPVPGETPKLGPRWDGPYVVHERISRTAYGLANVTDPDKQITVVHRSDLTTALDETDLPLHPLNKVGRPALTAEQKAAAAAARKAATAAMKAQRLAAREARDAEKKAAAEEARARKRAEREAARSSRSTANSARSRRQAVEPTSTSPEPNSATTPTAPSADHRSPAAVHQEAPAQNAAAPGEERAEAARRRHRKRRAPQSAPLRILTRNRGQSVPTDQPGAARAVRPEPAVFGRLGAPTAADIERDLAVAHAMARAVESAGQQLHRPTVFARLGPPGQLTPGHDQGAARPEGNGPAATWPPTPTQETTTEDAPCKKPRRKTHRGRRGHGQGARIETPADVYPGQR